MPTNPIAAAGLLKGGARSSSMEIEPMEERPEKSVLKTEMERKLAEAQETAQAAVFPHRLGPFGISLANSMDIQARPRHWMTMCSHTTSRPSRARASPRRCSPALSPCPALQQGGTPVRAAPLLAHRVRAQSRGAGGARRLRVHGRRGSDEEHRLPRWRVQGAPKPWADLGHVRTGRINGQGGATWPVSAARVLSAANSLLPIPVTGSIARGTQRLNFLMRGSMERALNNSAVGRRVLWPNYRSW